MRKPPIGSPVLSLHVLAPLPVPRMPPAEEPACSVRWLPSRWTAVGLSTLLSWGPHSLLAEIYSPVLSSPHLHMPDPGRWRGQPFWWATQSSACCHPPPRSSPRGLWLPSLRSHPDCNVPGPPSTLCCICKQASTSTADSLLIPMGGLAGWVLPWPESLLTWGWGKGTWNSPSRRLCIPIFMSLA